MNNWFEEIRDEILSFIDNATDEEIRRELERANCAQLMTIDAPVLENNERYFESASIETVCHNKIKGLTVKNKGKIDRTGYALTMKKFNVADVYRYRTAA